MNLDNFENSISLEIVNRGRNYHRNKAILYVEETDENVWVAEVEGTEIYNVEITLNGKEITDYFCDCPYDGQVCKHTVAVFA